MTIFDGEIGASLLDLFPIAAIESKAIVDAVSKPAKASLSYVRAIVLNRLTKSYNSVG
jgi:hypothetical protein